MLSLCYGHAVFSLPRDAVLARLEEAPEKYLKALLLLAADESLRTGYPDNAELCAAAVGLSGKAFREAVDYWTAAGVLTAQNAGPAETAVGTAAPAAAEKPSGAPAEQTSAEKPSVRSAGAPSRTPYSGAELEKLLDGREEIRQLIGAVENILGKVLSPAEINKVVELTDYLRLDNAYLTMLTYYCVKTGKPTVAYIYKTAWALSDEGITTADALDETIRFREKEQTLESHLRTLIGIGSRALTPREKAAFKTWISDWRFDEAMLDHAYEITIDTRGKGFSLPYMNRILENWHNAGHTTVEQADGANAEFKRQQEESAGQASSFETDEFFSAALARSYRELGGAPDASAADPAEAGKGSGNG